MPLVMLSPGKCSVFWSRLEGKGGGLEKNIFRKHVSPIFQWKLDLKPKSLPNSGGLRVLAGDTIKSAADLKTPMVAITLLYRKGYFERHLNADGWQQEIWDERNLWNTKRVIEQSVFTTHTPVPAGHDRFPYSLVEKLRPQEVSIDLLKELAGKDEEGKKVIQRIIQNTGKMQAKSN